MSNEPSDPIRELYARKRAWHDAQAQLPLREKFRILIELQRQDHPLIARHRRLHSWERPWKIDP